MAETTRHTQPRAGGPPDEPGDGRVDAARGEARAVGERARVEAGAVAGEARDRTARLAGEARDAARQRADEGAGRAAEILDGLAHELSSMADASADTEGNLAGFARDGARALGRVAGRLDDRGVDGALDEVRRFARRRPVVFLAGAFVAGAGLGRLTRNVDTDRIASAVRDGDDPPQAGHAAGTAPAIPPRAGRPRIGGAGVPPTARPTGPASGPVTP